MTDTSKTPKWTKGPWTVGFRGEYETHNPNIVYAENGDSVASVWGVPLHTTLEDLQRSGNTSDSEGMANARLIAAAPEMAELLRDFVRLTAPKSFDVELEQRAERLLKELES